MWRPGSEGVGNLTSAHSAQNRRIKTMGDLEDSTTDTQWYSDEDRQGVADHYLTLMSQLVQGNPWISVPEILDRLVG